MSDLNVKKAEDRARALIRRHLSDEMSGHGCRASPCSLCRYATDLLALADLAREMASVLSGAKVGGTKKARMRVLVKADKAGLLEVTG